MAAVITEIPDVVMDQTDRRHAAFRVKEIGTIMTIVAAITIMVAETTIAITTMTMIVTQIMILIAIAEEVVMRMEIADVTMNPVLIPDLIPDHMTIQDADATISNDQRVALSFWLTGRKGNVKLGFGTTLGE